RGAGAAARVLAASRGAAAHARVAVAAAPDAQAFALRVSDHGEPLSREAHHREARRSREAHAVGIRQCDWGHYPAVTNCRGGLIRDPIVPPMTECTVAGEKLVLLPEKVAYW